MPSPLQVADATLLTYSGSSVNAWTCEVQSYDGVTAFGTMTNAAGWADGSEVTAVAIRLFFDDGGDPLDITAEDTLTLSFDGDTQVIQLPAIINPVVYYVSIDGLLFTDAALTTGVDNVDQTSDGVTVAEVPAQAQDTMPNDGMTVAEAQTQSVDAIDDSMTIDDIISFHMSYLLDNLSVDESKFAQNSLWTERTINTTTWSES